MIKVQFFHDAWTLGFSYSRRQMLEYVECCDPVAYITDCKYCPTGELRNINRKNERDYMLYSNHHNLQRLKG